MNDFILNVQTHLAPMLSNKKVLFLPIYSMREYDTGLYNMESDGNVSYILSFFAQAYDCDISITIPKNTKNLDFFINNLLSLGEKNNLHFHFIKFPYKANALKTRTDSEWIRINSYTTYPIKDYDIVVFTPNILALREFPTKESVYLVTHCVFDNPKNPFIRFDNAVHPSHKVIVCAPKQKEVFFPDAVIDNNWYNPELIDSYMSKPIKFNQKIIFLPFRQSHADYHIEEIYEILLDLKLMDFLLLYTTPNNFEISVCGSDFINKLKVSTDRRVVYNILKSRPIIPFLPNLEKNLHSTLFEFIHFNCKLIYFKNSHFHHKEHKGEITDISQLKQTLINFLEE